MNRRIRLLLVMIGITAAGWYLVRFEGDPVPVAPPLVAPLRDAAPAWESQPTLVQHTNEPAAIYVVTGVPGPDGLFEALHLDVNSGARSSARIPFGPGTPYVPFDSAEVIGVPAIEFRGLAHRRPTLRLLKFPGPGGPGFELVDSATGVVHIVAGTGNAQRTLATLTLFNSSRLPELRSLLWSNGSRSLAAFLWRDDGAWTLYLFSLVPAPTETARISAVRL